MSFDLATELAERGLTQSELGQLIGVHKSAVTRWAKWGMPIPPLRAVDIEKATGIPRARMRPDLFSPSEKISAGGAP